MKKLFYKSNNIKDDSLDTFDDANEAQAQQ